MSSAYGYRAFDPHIFAVRPLTEAAEALADVEGGHSAGETVLDLTR